MKKAIISLIICLTMLGLITAPALAEAQSEKHMVTGGGTVESPYGLGLVTCGFNAQQLDDANNAKG